MPVLGFLLMVAAGAAVWWWRLKMVKEAGSEIIDSVERLRGAYKRRKYSKAAESAPLATIQNPAIAAVVFLLALANDKPMYKDAAKEIVRERMKGIIAPQDMDEVIVFADWTSKSVISADDPIRRFRDMWLTSLDEAERRQLIEMAEAVADVGGERTMEQKNTLLSLRRTLLN